MIIGPITRKEVERCENTHLGGFEGKEKRS
jgi:hypothetical protein